MARSLAPEISTWPDPEPQLVGCSCTRCGATTFPAQERCPKCSGQPMERVLLPRSGRLVSWTTQEFPPGPPFAGPTGKSFVPFGVGLVQLGDVIRVEGRLTQCDPEKLDFDMEVELTFVPLATDDDGEDVMTYAFRPTAEERQK